MDQASATTGTEGNRDPGAGLIEFARNMVKALGLPNTVFERYPNALYLKIVDESESGGLAEIGLWRSSADRQIPMITLSWRKGDSHLLVASSVEKPIRPLQDFLDGLFRDSQKMAIADRRQSIAVIGTIMRYLETAR